MGVLAGQGRRRRLVILGGGIVFVLTLLAVASARSFAVLLAAFVAFYPASGAFVSLTQAEIMDAWPDRQAQVMARWDLAGAAGAVAGPLLLTAVLASGGELAGRLPGAGRDQRADLARRAAARPAAAGRPDGRGGRGGGGQKRSSGRGRRESRRSVPRCGTGERCAGCC